MARKKNPTQPGGRNVGRREGQEERSVDEGEKKHRNRQGVRDALRSIADRLPYGKLTGAQVHNLASDLIGAVLCLAFIVKSDSYLLNFVCIACVLALSYLCLMATDRRRRF